MPKQVNVAIIGLGLRGGVHSDLSGPSEGQHGRHLPAERREAEQGRRRRSASTRGTPSTTTCWPIPRSISSTSTRRFPTTPGCRSQALKAGKHVMCTVPMATTIKECDKICRAGRRDRPQVHDGRDGRLQPRVPVHQGDVQEGRARQDPAPGRLAPAGHGRLARLLAEDDPDALRHARRQPLPGPDRQAGPSTSRCFGSGTVREGHRQKIGQQVRRRDVPHQDQGLRRRRPTSGDSCTTRPASIARASTSTARRRASSGRWSSTSRTSSTRPRSPSRRFPRR